jgi:hypothetical protein
VLTETIPPDGCSTLELVQSGRLNFASGGSEYLSKCERVPEIICSIKKHVPENETIEVDRLFVNFAANKIPYDVSKILVGDLADLGFQPAIRDVESGSKGVAKYFQVRKPLDLKATEALATAFKWMERHFGCVMQESMVIGLEETLHFATLDKSPGCLWRQYWKTKAEMVNDDYGKKIIEDYWDSLATVRASDVFFGAHLKEELRAREKIISKSTRLFIAAPCEHTLSGIRLFHDQNKKLIRSALSTFSAVGMNKYQLGWHKLQIRLSRFPNNESLDTKNFDGSIIKEILWHMAHFRFSMLAKRYQTFENRLRIYNWYYQLINSIIVLPDGSVVIKEDGMPSGVLTTSSDDTIINFIYIVFAYLYNGGPVDYQFFVDNFMAALFGDDNLNNYSNEIKQWVNGVAYASAMKHVFNITTTNVGLQSWDTLSFLSHQFGHKFGMVVPLLSRDRIICSQIIGSSDPLKSAERASAFRILSWPYDDLFQLFTTYLVQLCDEFDYIPRSLINIEQDIHDLYLSYENISGSMGKTNTRNKNMIDNLYKYLSYDENCISKTPSKSSCCTTAKSPECSTDKASTTSSTSTQEVQKTETLGGSGGVDF